MTGILYPIVIVFIGAIVASLLTFTVTTLSNKSNMEKTAMTAVNVHEKIKHQDSMYTYVEKELKEHKEECGAVGRIRKIEKVVMAIYVKQGGNIEELDI